MSSGDWLNRVRKAAERTLNDSICSLGITASDMRAVDRVLTDFSDNDFVYPQEKAATENGESTGGSENESRKQRYLTRRHQ